MQMSPIRLTVVELVHPTLGFSREASWHLLSHERHGRESKA